MLANKFSIFFIFPALMLVDAFVAGIKASEAKWELLLPKHLPFVIRLDGVSFKRFTAGLQKPFDVRFTRAILATAMDLVERTAARMAFCQSDEITLVYPPASTGGGGGGESLSLDEAELFYGGRTQKIVSVVAGMASALFNRHFESQAGNSMIAAYFDARCFSVNSAEEAVDVLWWRHALDCRRNAINAIAQSHFSHKSLQGLAIQDVLRKLHSKSLDIHRDYPRENVFGVFIKRVQVEHRGLNPLTGEHVACQRVRIQGRSFDWKKEQRDASFVMDRFWTADSTPPDALIIDRPNST